MHHQRKIYVVDDFLGDEECRQMVRKFREIDCTTRGNVLLHDGTTLNGVEAVKKDLECIVEKASKIWRDNQLDLQQYLPFFVHHGKDSKDNGMENHTDESHVTLNICLGCDSNDNKQELQGGRLHFDSKNAEISAVVVSDCKEEISKSEDAAAVVVMPQKIGRALLHRGDLAHFSEPMVQNEERFNLIIWFLVKQSGAQTVPFYDQYLHYLSLANLGSTSCGEKVGFSVPQLPPFPKNNSNSSIEMESKIFNSSFLFAQIMSHLPAKSVLLSSSVCRKWHASLNPSSPLFLLQKERQGQQQQSPAINFSPANAIWRHLVKHRFGEERGGGGGGIIRRDDYDDDDDDVLFSNKSEYLARSLARTSTERSTLLFAEHPEYAVNSIYFLHIGTTGCKIGRKMWEIMCCEHGVDFATGARTTTTTTATSQGEDEIQAQCFRLSVFFDRPTSSGLFHSPRALFVVDESYDNKVNNENDEFKSNSNSLFAPWSFLAHRENQQIPKEPREEEEEEGGGEAVVEGDEEEEDEEQQEQEEHIPHEATVDDLERQTMRILKSMIREDETGKRPVVFFTAAGDCALSSTLLPRLVQRITAEIPRAMTMGALILPSEHDRVSEFDDIAARHYRAAVLMHELHQAENRHETAVFLFDNQAVLNLLQKRIDDDDVVDDTSTAVERGEGGGGGGGGGGERRRENSPSNDTLHSSPPNRFPDSVALKQDLIDDCLAEAISCISFPHRKGAYSTLEELVSSLVPYPGIIFATLALKTLPLGRLRVASNRFPVVQSIFTDPECRLVSGNQMGKFMSVYLQTFGNIVPADVMRIVSTVKTSRNMQFVDWVPTGFKCSIAYTTPCRCTAPSMMSIVSNSTGILPVVSKFRQWAETFLRNQRQGAEEEEEEVIPLRALELDLLEIAEERGEDEGAEEGEGEEY